MAVRDCFGRFFAFNKNIFIHTVHTLAEKLSISLKKTRIDKYFYGMAYRVGYNIISVKGCGELISENV